MEKTSEISDQLKAQLEYYFSDINLSRDTFFFEKINETTDGFIPIELFLNCNNIKKLAATLDQIKEQIEESDKLDLSEDKSKARRKDNKALPEFKAQKKLKVADVPEGVPVNNDEEKVAEAP